MGFPRRKPKNRYESLDKLEEHITELRKSRFEARTLESFTKHLRMAMYSEDRLSRKAIVEVIKTGDKKLISEMSKLLDRMKDAEAHPRELRDLYERAKEFNRTQRPA